MKLPNGGQPNRGKWPLFKPRATAESRPDSLPRLLPSDVRVFEIEPEVTVGSNRGAVMLSWRGSPTVDALRRLDGYTARVLEEHPRVVVLVVIEPGNTQTPSAEARAEYGRLTQKYESVCAGIGTILEGDSVKQTIVRFSLTTIQLLSSTNMPQPVFDSMQAGARWAAQHLPPLTVREIVHSLSGLRALKYAEP